MRLQAFVAIVLALGVTGSPGLADELRGKRLSSPPTDTTCTGGTTALATNTGCAAGWLDKVPDADDDMSKPRELTSWNDYYDEDPRSDMPWQNNVKSVRQRSLTRDNCPAMTILKWDTVHRVLVQCTKGGADAGAPTWVNVDFLKCQKPAIDPKTGSYPGCPGGDSEPLSRDKRGKQIKDLKQINAKAEAIIGRADLITVGMQRKLWKDHEALDKQYGHLTSRQLYAAVSHARESLSKTRDALVSPAMFGKHCERDIEPVVEKDKKGKNDTRYYVTDSRPGGRGRYFLHKADLDRAQRTCKLMLGAAALSDDLIVEAEHSAGPNLSADVRENVIGNMIRVKMQQKTLNLADAMDSPQLMEQLAMQNSGYGVVGQYSELVLRQVMFAGLDGYTEQLNGFKDKEWEIKMPKDLEFIRKSPEIAGVKELHNGYVYGGSRLPDGSAGEDCSDLVSTVLFKSGAEIRASLKDRGEKTDAKKGSNAPDSAFYFALASGKPVADKWKGLAKGCFKVLDLRAGERPQAGDIAVIPGHIVFVKNYDDETGRMQTTEAGGAKFNTVGNFDRPLFERNCANQYGDHAVRGDVRILRLLPGCPMVDSELR